MTQYYVSPTGLDTNSGLTPALAFLTFSKADSVVVAGDRVRVLPGTYTLSATFVSTASGTAGNPIIWDTGVTQPWLAPGPANNAVIAGGNASIEFIQINIKGNYVYWRGFEFNEPTASVCFDIWGTNCKVQYCYIHDVASSASIPANTPGAGVFDSGGNGAADNEFAYNLIVRMSIINSTNVANAVVHCIYSSGTHNFIHHNICISAPGYGVYCHGTTNTNDHTVVANNLCAAVANAGIAFGCGSGTAVDFMYAINNILINNGLLGGAGYGIRETDGNAQTGLNSIYDHNLTWNNSLGGYSLQNSLVATNQVTTQPIFRNYQADGTGDYHPYPGSPSIDSGTGALPSWLPVGFGWTLDLGFNLVPQGAGFDIGPYEYVPPIASLPQYTLRVRDHTLTPQGAFTAWTAGDVVLRMNDVGKWALTVKADDPLLAYFATRGAGIIITCDLGDGFGARTVCSGPVWVITRLGLDNEYTLAGPTDEWWLAAREAMPAGGSPYMEVILDDSPTRYYRLDETSGSTINDFASTNPQTGTYVGAPTLGVTGGVVGDPDTAVTLNGTTQRLTLSAANMGLTNSPMSFVYAFKFAANPAAASFIGDYGGATRALHGNLGLFIDTAGKLNTDTGAGSVIISAAALTTAVWHLAHVTWDGTSMKMFLDGVQSGSTITPAAQNIPNPRNWYAGANTAGAAFFAGQLDEIAAFNNVALTAAQIAQHWASFSATHAAYDARSGVSSTVIIGYVNANLVAPTNTYRTLSGLALAADPGIGTSVKGNARDEPLLPLLQQLALSGGDIGFKLVQTANGVLTFSVYQPTDRTTSVIFSSDLKNLFDYQYSLAGPLANSVLVRGGGVLAGRTAIRQRDNASITAWGLVEGVLDARDTQDVPTMAQRGSAAVTANTELTNLAVTPGDAGRVRFLVDYQLGDTVSMVIDGNTITNKIRSVHIELKNPGDQEKITPGIGTPSQGDVAHWFDAGAARAKALALVQQKLNKLSTVV